MRDLEVDGKVILKWILMKEFVGGVGCIKLAQNRAQLRLLPFAGYFAFLSLLESVERRIVGSLMNCQGWGRKWSWPIKDTTKVVC